MKPGRITFRRPVTLTLGGQGVHQYRPPKVLGVGEGFDERLQLVPSYWADILELQGLLHKAQFPPRL